MRRVRVATKIESGPIMNLSKIYSSDNDVVHHSIQGPSMPFARSVLGAVAHSAPGRIISFGGEVDPSSLGHEEAGKFCSDLTALDPVSRWSPHMIILAA